MEIWIYNTVYIYFIDTPNQGPTWWYQLDCL
jgi:hypothetical protein